MEQGNIVIHFWDGRIIKGYGDSPFPGKEMYHLNSTDGIELRVDLIRVKAIFRVKSFEGNPSFDPIRDGDVLRGIGDRHLVEIQFLDGETLCGEIRSGDLKRDLIDLHILEADDNNIEVYIPISSILSLKILQ